MPLNGETTYGVTRAFAKAVAELLAKEHPKLIVAEMARAERKGKVFIDWSQNADFKTTVGVYSLRAKRARPFVSVPVTWQELDSIRRTRKTETLYFEPSAALQRLEQVGDLFAAVLNVRQSLPELVTAVAASSRRTRKGLQEYNRKRDFSKTSEPRPTAPRASAQGSRKRFVIQKHAAGHLHYDFRLEMHGALKSWAVPKGVPYQVDERRLAMATEDHPLEYLAFEGTIPKGQYGGGTVMVWDIGTYELIEGNYYKGDLQIHLKGKKLKGTWHLVKSREKAGKNWFLVKTGEAMKPLAPKKENASALTGRTLEEIAEAKGAEWHSNRTIVPGLDLDALPLSELLFVEPMLAKPVAALPEGADWQYEIKLDGYRALVVKESGAVRLLSRRNNLMNESGERSGNWVKFRVNRRQELVIGGYRAGGSYFDNLAVGYYNEAQKLIFIAKIKNGFTPEDKRQLAARFRGLETKKCPFDNLPKPKSARRGEALTADAMKNYRWLKPKLVAQIEFTDWTSADHLRHSRFVGLREDKDAREVVKEQI